MKSNTSITGLTAAEVEQRKKQGLQNSPKKVLTKSYKQIFFENTFSLFNFINVAIFIILLYVGSFKNCLFIMVVVCNTFIGIVQEIRSKRVIDKLSIVNQSTATVIRDGRDAELDVSELVRDDVVRLRSGCQVSNDCTVVQGSCEVNESLITGESDSVFKDIGSKLLSGSFIVSGSCLCKIDNVGSENYADSILNQISYVKKSSSEIVRVIKRIIVVISICIIPFGGMLFYNQYNLAHNTLADAVVNSAAAIIGMIPEGLVLLISTVFALGVVRLSKKKVLSQDLYSLESLARTDVLCLDKTGTVTTGEMNVEKLVPVKGVSKEELEHAVTVLAASSGDNNSTITALKTAFSNKIDCTVVSAVPFSSERKWSAVTTTEHGTYAMGAGEMLFGDRCDYSAIKEGERESYRIVTIAYTKEKCCGRELPGNLRPVGFVLLSEKIRESIDEAFSFFKNEGVALKIISGDNPDTVKKLCSKVMGSSEINAVDMSKVSDDDIPKIVEGNSVFGRVSPSRKKLIVKALKDNGHTVGMVGDGVNDVLALKESDCSVGLANGSEAARNVSQIVLLDSDFRSLPAIVSEGRRSINNLQNSASLFLAKTIFSAVMTLIFMFAELPYPFEPIQISLISALTIGIPSVVLSLEKNNNPIRGHFIINVIKRCIPASLTNIVLVMTAVIVGYAMDMTDRTVSSICVSIMAATGIMLILYTYKPLNRYRAIVVAVSIVGFVGVFMLCEGFFGLAPTFGIVLVYELAAAALSVVVFNVLIRLFDKAKQPQSKS